ncbi:MAG: helix-turn-helix domain-containing protein [Bacteroidaceae bacterium]|nr:helix-turn-helix domain-containing protein [Bacteroidaceae bacterium]
MRTIRLRCAAELLREGRMNITEISYAMGFSSVSYFSRCFRAMFGVPPTRFCGSMSAET